MAPPFLLVLAGPPGAGKTTLASLVASRFSPSVALEGDALLAGVHGLIDPWRPEAAPQARALVRASLRAAVSLVRDGYTTVLAAHLGPWVADLLAEEAGDPDLSLRYVILRPSLSTCQARCVDRQRDHRHAGALREVAAIGALCAAYSQAGEYETAVLDTDGLSVTESVGRVLDAVGGDCHRVATVSESEGEYTS